MEDIIADAAALGKKIAAHPRLQTFMVAAKAVNADPAALELLQRYQESVDRIRHAEMSGQPIEPTDKRAVAECESKVVGNDLLRNMMKAQADYLELMNRINEAIDSATGMAQIGS